MMTWNHRVYKDEHGNHSIVEVYYNQDGVIENMTDSPVSIEGYESVSDIKFELDLLIGATNKPVLTDEDLPWMNEDE